jgi:putative ABC transport system permease protein
MLATLRQDVRFVLRVLGRRRVFAVVTVSTLGLGIGAATSIFGIADAVLFRPLAFPDPARLITVWQTHPELKKNPARAALWDRGGISLPAFRAWHSAQTSFDEVAVWTASSTIVGGAEGPEELQVVHASASLLPVLGISPEHGRGFAPEEDAVGGMPVALVSHEAWASRFGRDPRIAGRVVRIDGVLYSIVGVLPVGLTLDRRTTRPSYWIPAGQDTDAAGDPGTTDFRAIARLRRGVTVAAAAAETERFLQATTPDGTEPTGALLLTLQDDQTRDVRQPILILLAASGLLLLIACANVATLLTGEATGRAPELRARMALGASRARLIRQMLTESTVLAVLGGALGTLLAGAATKLLIRIAPPSIPGLADARLDARVFTVALAVSCATGLIFGIVPALLLTRSSDLSSAFRAVGQTPPGRGRAQRALVACEVALSMVLLVAAGLLVRSFERISAVDPGFRTDHLLVVGIRLPQPQYSDTVRLRALYRDLVARARAVPGVASAAVTTTPPFSGGSSSSSFEVEAGPVVAGATPREAQRRITTPAYFSTAGLPIVAGRSYSDGDGGGAPLVVVVNRSLARQEWPNESALGKRIRWMGDWRTVVGVAGDVRLHDLVEDSAPVVYAPVAQLVRTNDPWLVLRTTGEPLDVARATRIAVHDVAADVAVSGVDRMSGMVAASLSEQRFRTELITLFAALAALLAAIGMYGVAATTASRRAREMAVRVALGATSASIVRLMMGTGASGVAVGALAGVPLALAATRVLSPYLYAVGAADPATYAAALALLGLTTIAANWVPARRATRVPVVETLRGQ